MNEVLVISSLVLILIAIKTMNNSSRYLYRYIAFCIAEFINSSITILWDTVSNDTRFVFIIVIAAIYLTMTTWRIVEVTVLNNYFNSLNKNPDYERFESYIPPNQALL